MVDIFEFAQDNNIDHIEFSKEESLFRPDADFIVKMKLRKLIKELEKES